MQKSDLFELIREINKISPEEKPIIVGSQAVHVFTEDLPEIARKSIECDFLFAGGRGKMRAEINKKLGVFSNFQIEHGFYADALGLATVVLPENWRDRLQPLFDDKGEIVAYCAEIHDIAVSKLIAGRKKDFQFLKAIFQLEIISVKEFISRVRFIELMPQSAVLTDRLEKLSKYLFGQKIESKIIWPIREYLRELRTNS